MSRDVVLIHATGSTGEQWAGTRDHFERLGWTVHTPTLRHHDASVTNQANLVAGVSLRDNTADIADLTRRLDTPLIGGSSLGGLIAQLVAARTAHRGLFCLAPAPGPGMLGPLWSALTFGRHFLQATPWRKPVSPASWEVFRRSVANEQDEETAREMYSGHLLFDSARAYSEIFFPYLDRGRAARVDYGAVTGPVLVIGAARDRIISTNICKRTAARYAHGQYVEIDGADHMLTGGRFLPVVLRHLDQWTADNHLAPATDTG
jgi:pimeloyl-ACP methyl ester carboxylesterase